MAPAVLGDTEPVCLIRNTIRSRNLPRPSYSQKVLRITVRTRKPPEMQPQAAGPLKNKTKTLILLYPQ